MNALVGVIFIPSRAQPNIVALGKRICIFLPAYKTLILTFW